MTTINIPSPVPLTRQYGQYFTPYFWMEDTVIDIEPNYDDYYKIFYEKSYAILKNMEKYNNKTEEELTNIINNMWNNNYKFNIDELNQDDIEYMLE